MCRTALMQHFNLVTLFDLTLTLTVSQYKAHTYIRPFYPLGSLLVKFGLTAVISPVSVADKAKSDDFDLRPDLT